MGDDLETMPMSPAVAAYCRARADGTYFKNDADAVNFARELTHIISETYDVEFPELTMANGDIIPIDTTIPTGAESYTYYTYEATGIARVMNTYSASSIPRGNLAGKKHTAQIHSIPFSYGWNIQDMRASQMAGQKYNLSNDQAAGAKRATMQVIDDIGWFGDDEFDLVGMISHPNVTHTITPVGGTSGERSLAKKDSDEVLADFGDLINTPENITNRVEKVTHVVVASDIWATLHERPRSSTSDTSIAKWLIANYPDITFAGVARLKSDAHDDAAEFAGEALMMAYTKRKGRGELVISQQFEQMTPQQEGLETVIYTHARCGGVKLPYPLSVHVFRDIAGEP